MFWKRNINDINMLKSCLVCNLMRNFYFNINNLTKRQRNASIQSIFQKYIFELCLLYMRYNTHVYTYIRASLSLHIYIYIFVCGYACTCVWVRVCVFHWKNCNYFSIFFVNSFCLGTSEGIRYQLHLNMIAQEELEWKHLWNATNFC